MKVIQDISATIALCIFFTVPAQAAYDANINTTITDVVVYKNNGILIKADPMPATSCAYSDYFAIDYADTASVVERLYARALLAMQTGEVLRIGYSGAGDECVSGRPTIHRIGD